MKQDGRGRHGNCGRKKIADPRINSVNIRLNNAEKLKFEWACNDTCLSQADFIMMLVDLYIQPAQEEVV
jgi:hypothetical protein